MASLISDFGGLLWTVGSFLIALGVIVAVHEYGHYITGRLSGIKADVFSLGFGPVVASRMDRHGTRWQFAAIPLGGFVRFRGDRDAASAQAADMAGEAGRETGSLSKAEARQTMAGAPLWARALTVAAGPIFNFILAFVIFLGVVIHTGRQSDTPIVGKLYPMPAAQAQGLQVGDQILAMNGAATPDTDAFYQVANGVGPDAEVTYKVARGGQTLDVMAGNPFPARASSVHLQSAALEAGLREGDVVLKVDDQVITAFSQLPILVEASKGAPLHLLVWRPDLGEMTVTLSPNRRDLPTAEGGFETRWLMGLSSGLLFEPELRRVGLIEGAKISLAQMASVVKGTYSGMAHMLRGQISSCNLSGPVGLASTMGDAARTGLISFISMLGMVSMGVGILNLLPVPILDGGHLVFFAIEAVTRRKPNPRVVNAAVLIGLFLVLALTAFALGNDLTCA